MKLSKNLFPSIMALGLVACAAPKVTTTAASPDEPPGAAPESLDLPKRSPMSIDLFYDTELAKTGFPSPFVRGSVAGSPEALFLVDTGASANVLSSWFAETLSQATSGTISVPDATGAMVEVSVRKASLGLGSLEFPERTFFTTDFPASFEESSIAGIISPQSLGAAVAMDFGAPRLAIYPSWDELLGDTQLKPIAKGKSLVCLSSFGNLYAIQIGIENDMATLLVDSGANGIKLHQQSEAGQSLIPEARNTDKGFHGIGGQKTSVLEIASADITVEDFSTKAVVHIHDSAGKGCPSDGTVGMALLKQCVVGFGPEDIGIRCE